MSVKKIFRFDEYFQHELVKLKSYVNNFQDCWKMLTENQSSCDCASFSSLNMFEKNRVYIPHNYDIATNFQASNECRLKLVLNSDLEKSIYIDRFTILPLMCAPYTNFEIVPEGEHKCCITYDAYLCKTEIRNEWVPNPYLIKSSGLTFFNGICSF